LLVLLVADKFFCVIFISKKGGEAENKYVNLQKQSCDQASSNGLSSSCEVKQADGKDKDAGGRAD
ncbi:MAG: hypothetical protein K2G01_00310, partial [Paramuribaculum sp.]|nr:hypothetical protein [Paramuribaculum sp.]